MSQKSSQEITAQIKKLKRERKLMQLLEEKYPREKKSLFAMLPYDCMENIYNFLHPEGLSRYRLAKALHRDKIHYDISYLSFKENIFLWPVIGILKSEKRVNKLKLKLGLTDDHIEKIKMDKKKKTKSELSKFEYCDKYTATGIKPDGSYYDSYGFGLNYVQKYTKIFKESYRGGIYLMGKYKTTREQENGTEKEYTYETRLSDYTEPIPFDMTKVEVLRTMKDDCGGEWAFIKAKSNNEGFLYRVIRFK